MATKGVKRFGGLATPPGRDPPGRPGNLVENMPRKRPPRNPLKEAALKEAALKEAALKEAARNLAVLWRARDSTRARPAGPARPNLVENMSRKPSPLNTLKEVIRNLELLAWEVLRPPWPKESEKWFHEWGELRAKAADAADALQAPQDLRRPWDDTTKVITVDAPLPATWDDFRFFQNAGFFSAEMMVDDADACREIIRAVEPGVGATADETRHNGSTARRRGRLEKTTAETLRVEMLAKLFKHPSLKDDPRELALQTGVSERTIRRWLEREGKKHQNRERPAEDCP